MKANQIICGDALETLKGMPDQSVHCCVTSPPYWGLRDYGTATWEGGDADCDHMMVVDKAKRFASSGLNKAKDPEKVQSTIGDQHKSDTDKDGNCRRCGATRVDNQLGLEKTPEEYTERLTELFREVRRALRDDGTLWLNLGDSYNTTQAGNKEWGNGVGANKHYQDGSIPRKRPKANLKPKDLVGIPWRVAFALQADGWYLRSDIIWHKPNPMPESVTDRPTKSHEYIFLLSKSSTYHYDADAIKETSINTPEQQEAKRNKRPHKGQSDPGGHRETTAGFTETGIYPTRNKRSVWTVTTKPYKEAHFATFPEDLIIPCIKAGTSEKGCCRECGAPWERMTEAGDVIAEGGKSHRYFDARMDGRALKESDHAMQAHECRTLGWKPSCPCDAGDPEPCIVLDPFMGSGTTALVALKLNRKYLGIELNPDYCNLAEKRLKDKMGLFL